MTFINSSSMIFNMQKFVSYLVVVAMVIVSVALMSCDKDDKRTTDEECICIYSSKSGQQLIGSESISEEILEALTFRMYPNPTSDVAYLIFETAGLNAVTITDKKGKVLLEQSFDVQTIAINVSDYSAGKYQVKVDNGKQESILCLIKVEN